MTTKFPLCAAMMQLFTTILSLLVPVNVKHIDYVTARTTMRLWHDIHVERQIEHDFQDMFDPRQARRKGSFFVAAVGNDEIKAIVQCTRRGVSHLAMRRIAHAIDHEGAAEALVKMMIHERITVDETIRTQQPRWFLAYNYYKKT